MSASTYSPPLSVIMLRTVVLNCLSANVTNFFNALDASGFALQEVDLLVIGDSCRGPECAPFLVDVGRELACW